MNIIKSFLLSMLVLFFICGCTEAPKEDGTKPKDEGIKTPPAKTGEAVKPQVEPPVVPEKKKTVQELVLQLNTTTGDQRQEASDALREMGEAAVPQIMPMLDDPKPETRLHGAVALGIIGPPAAQLALPKLKELAEKDADEKVKEAAANSVKQIQTRL